MRAARLLAILLTLAAILAALVYVFRLPMAGWAVRSAMAGAGFENPAARVTALSFSGARLEDVAAGPELAPDFSFEAIEADFHPRRLWTEKKADALRAGPGVARVKVDDAGRASFAGFEAGGEGEGVGAALPFDRLLLRNLKVFILAPDTNARAIIDAEYDIGKGGKGAVTLEAKRFVWRDIHFSEVEGSASADLSADGKISLAADLKAASAGTEGAIANNLDMKLDGEAADWRDAANGKADALAGRMRFDFSAPDIELNEPAAQSVMSAAPVEAVLGTALRRGALNGAVIIDFSQAALTARIAGGKPLTLATPDGALLTVRQQGEAPFYKASGGRMASSFGFALESDGVDASGGVDFAQEGGGWRLAAPVEIAEFASGPLSLAGSRVDLSAMSDGAIIDAALGLKSGLKRLEVGRLTISDAPFSGAFGIKADMNARRATIVSKSDCFTIERGRGVIKAQNLETRISAMTLCNGDGPLGVVTWNGETVFALAGDLAAKTAMFRMGETRAEGRPPAIRIDASYRPNEEKTEIKGAAEGGAMTLNNALDMAGVVGRFEITLDAETLRASANVDRLRIAQHLRETGQARLVSPVVAAGEASLKGSKAEFAYTLTTPEGRRLGRGEGTHDMMTASGETAFSLGNLAFAPGALQPNRISPALKGIVDAAEGGMDGAIRFGWSPDGVTSSADFQFNEISFVGPTRAVTRTSGLNGSVQLTNLWPVTTDGLQTITVSAVDMDALQLGAGAITFDMPGDDSIHLAEAEFPWFGGTIGVYDAKAAFTGEAVIPLRADNADLAKILDYVDVDGLSGEGVLSGELPVTFEDGKARIENGYFKSEGPGVLSYVGKGTDAASERSGEADVAFDLLRDFRYESMRVEISGPLDGDLDFVVALEGAGEITLKNQAMIKEGKGRIPARYTISLEAPLLALINQARLSQDFRLQYEQMQRTEPPDGGARAEDGQ
ncbi:intermembrane phospholipid transport protein YdbH family protein [Hyphococcus luteus]|uniref:Uncharacterized protein n=1 Tax=Hyphococcus luteus TaxID=2058213 RepID=A0A2S7KA95_9PROT|nr:YdbH domain-containing protein [Marinicaulis flavus]PQA89440.1 hypothetical protein CW354_00785 [Marinicaulis flavus]